MKKKWSYLDRGKAKKKCPKPQHAWMATLDCDVCVFCGKEGRKYPLKKRSRYVN